MLKVSKSEPSVSGSGCTLNHETASRDEGRSKCPLALLTKQERAQELPGKPGKLISCFNLIAGPTTNGSGYKSPAGVLRSYCSGAILGPCGGGGAGWGLTFSVKHRLCIQPISMRFFSLWHFHSVFWFCLFFLFYRTSSCTH